MKKFLSLLVVIILFVFSANAQTADNKPKKVYDENINQMEQIDAALLKAKEENKFVICQVGGNWCPWCLKFAEYITNDAEIKEIIDNNYVYIHVNYRPNAQKDKEKLAVANAMMKRLGNPGRFGYPVLVVLDENGKVVHIQDSGLLEQDSSYNKKHVVSFFKNWTPKVVKGQ